MSLEILSPCKVNLLLNILGKRPDGFHELETVMHPVNLCDRLVFDKLRAGVEISCDDPALPADSSNLVYRAAVAFLHVAGIKEGVRLRLEKKIPTAAGLGGGSGNAASTLLGLNELFRQPLAPSQLHVIAASIGSDVPFFLQCQPALATGRGEQVESLPPFPALRGAAFLLIHPGFGIPTAWTYKELAHHPTALHGRPGRARELLARLRDGDLASVGPFLYNSLEVPAFHKYPILALYQEFLRAEGAPAALMSGSGSTTFALCPSANAARSLEAKLPAKFGRCWTAVVPV